MRPFIFTMPRRVPNHEVLILAMRASLFFFSLTLCASDYFGTACRRRRTVCLHQPRVHLHLLSVQNMSVCFIERAKIAPCV